MKCSSPVKASKGFAALAMSAVLACGCLVPLAPAHAVTAAEKEAEAESALTQLNAMQQTLEERSAAYYQSLADYQNAVDKRDATGQRIEELNEEIASIQGRLGVRAREMYRNGTTSFIDLLLGAASFDEFTQNWALLNRVNETDATLSSRARALRSEAQDEQAVFAELARIAEQKSAEAGAAFEEAKTLVAQMQQTYESLSAEAKQLYAEEQEAAARAAAQAAAEAAAAQAAAQQAAAAQAAAAQDYGYADDYGYDYDYDSAATTVTEGGVANDDGTVTDVATGKVYSSASEYSVATGNEVVDRAMSMLGAGYSYGATGADGTFDCSGLVGYALTGSYERIGNTTTFMSYNEVSDPQPGDIVVNEGHTGIYIGDGQMIHASDEDTGVVVGKVQSGMIYVRP